VTRHKERTTEGVNGYRAIDGEYVGGGIWFPTTKLADDEPILLSAWGWYSERPWTGGYIVATDRRLIYVPGNYTGGMKPTVMSLSDVESVTVVRHLDLLHAWSLWLRAVALRMRDGSRHYFWFNFIQPERALEMLTAALENLHSASA
jgi:hypothetical protein